MAIRYAKDGDIETYDRATGKTTGHITTMGNCIEKTPEEIEADEKQIQELYEQYGIKPRKPR